MGSIPKLGGSPRGGKSKTHSSILAWKIPERKEPSICSSQGCKGVRHNSATKQQQSINMAHPKVCGLYRFPMYFPLHHFCFLNFVYSLPQKASLFPFLAALCNLWILVPWPGTESGWKCRVLTTGQPGNSPYESSTVRKSKVDFHDRLGGLSYFWQIFIMNWFILPFPG